MRYKLIEITYAEHVALYEAGVWVQWDPVKVDGTMWYTSTEDILNDPSSRAADFVKEINAKFYTRIEQDANQSE